jgi:hypothetical protein
VLLGSSSTTSSIHRPVIANDVDICNIHCVEHDTPNVNIMQRCRKSKHFIRYLHEIIRILSLNYGIHKYNMTQFEAQKKENTAFEKL